MSQSTQTLTKHKNQGYLFHGSPHPNLKIIEPREAKHSDKTNSFHNDTAVFASDAAESTVIFALVPPKSELPENLRKGKFSVHWTEDGTTIAKMPSIWKDFMQTRNGNIYVLPPDTFNESTGGRNNNIFKSKVAVKPVATVTVTLADFEELGGEVEWYGV